MKNVDGKKQRRGCGGEILRREKRTDKREEERREKMKEVVER
jgi:hypothetical protein